MPTVIDTLVLELGLDPTKFTEGQKQAVDNVRKMTEAAVVGGKEVEAQGKKVTEYFASIKREVLTTVGLFLGGRGVKEFTSYVTGLDAANSRLSYTLNMNVRDLSTWQGAIEQNGGSAASASSAMQGLSGEMHKFKLTGQTGMLPILNNLNVSLFDSNKKMRTAADMLIEINKAVQGRDPADAAAALSMLPGMNQDMMNLLLQAPDALRRYLDEAKKAGGTTEESAAAAKKYQQELANLERSATSLGRALTTTLGPAITSVFNSLSRLVQGWNISPGTPEAAKLNSDVNAKVRGKLGSPRAFMEWLMGPKTATELYGTEAEEQADFDRGQGHGNTPVAAPSVAQITSGRQTRGDRNNNPGNIEYGQFAIAHGATGTDGRFAVFPTKAAGEAAMDALLSKSYRGLTLAQIQRKWVGNADGGYLGSMMKATGLGADGVPDLGDPAVRKAIMSGMARGEGSHLGAGFGAGNSPGITNRGGDSSSNSTSITVGKIEVRSDKANPADVAQEVPDALRRMNWAASANSGLTG